MSTVDLSKFKTLYNQTALEYVKKLEDTVTLLRTDAANKNAMNEIYIAAHSLKSQSLMMGYLSLAQASLLIERFFHALREGAQPISTEGIDAVSELAQSVRSSLSEIVAGRHEHNLSDAISRFKKKMGVEE